MDITGDSQYQCWNLTEKDAEKVRELLSHAQKYEAIEMRDAIAAGLTGWWYGAYLMSLRILRSRLCIFLVAIRRRCGA